MDSGKRAAAKMRKVSSEPTVHAQGGSGITQALLREACAAQYPRLPSTTPAPTLLMVLRPMLQAGRLPACLHGLAGNGVWLLSLNLKEVERAVRDLAALAPCTCTCRSDMSSDAHQAAQRPPGGQQPDQAHHASVCYVVVHWPWASAAWRQLCLTLAHLACRHLTLQQQQASAQASCPAAACLAPPAGMSDGCHALDITLCQTCDAGEVAWAQRATIARVQPASWGGHVSWLGGTTMAVCQVPLLACAVRLWCHWQGVALKAQDQRLLADAW